MKLTAKLLGWLNGAFSKDPKPFLALRFQHSSGQMTWQVADAVLTTNVPLFPADNLSIDLTQYTVTSLAQFIGGQPGYVVPYTDTSTLSTLAASVLLDGAGDMNVSNGDHLYGYTNLNFSFLEASARELTTAASQIPNAIAQMSTQTAQDEWLDYLGGYYAVPRNAGELDGSYGPRIPAEVVRPRSNNVALEAAISYYTGQPTKVTDVVLYGATSPLFNSTTTFNGADKYNANGTPIYGLFDVAYGYDLINGADVSSFAATVGQIVNRLRAAGTHLRSLLLQGGTLADSLTAPTDSTGVFGANFPLTDALTAPTDAESANAAITPFADALTAPGDAESLTVNYNYQFNSVRSFNGVIDYMGGKVVTETV